MHWIEVIEPFFQHLLGEVPGPGEFSEDLSGEGEISPIDRPEQLGPQDRHILGISGADEKVAFVRAGSASHTDIEKEPKGSIPAQAIFHPFQDDLLPVLRQLPVFFIRVPFPRVREFEVLLMFGCCGVAVSSFSEFDRQGPSNSLDGGV